MRARQHALASVAANLTPAPLLLLPFTLLVSRVMRGDLPGVRFGWWVLSAVVTTAFTLLALPFFLFYVLAGRPVLARQGRRLTREHRLVLALWGRLLAGHQQTAVPQALVVAGEGRSLQRERLSLARPLPLQSAIRQ